MIDVASEIIRALEDEGTDLDVTGIVVVDKDGKDHEIERVYLSSTTEAFVIQII